MLRRAVRLRLEVPTAHAATLIDIIFWINETLKRVVKCRCGTVATAPHL